MGLSMVAEPGEPAEHLDLQDHVQWQLQCQRFHPVTVNKGGMVAVGILTVIITTFECMFRAAVFLAPPKYVFKSHKRNPAANILPVVNRYGIAATPTSNTYERSGTGMLDLFFQTIGKSHG